MFLRRAYLDLIGALPTPDEVIRFLDSSDPNKRAKLIDDLLGRDEFASFWAMKWADIMRGNREAISERGVHNFHRFLVRQFAEDRPFDRFARDVLTSRGNTIHAPAANFYRITRHAGRVGRVDGPALPRRPDPVCEVPQPPLRGDDAEGLLWAGRILRAVRLKGQRFGLDDEVVFVADEGEVTDPTRNQVQSPYAFGTSFRGRRPRGRPSPTARGLVDRPR